MQADDLLVLKMRLNLSRHNLILLLATCRKPARIDRMILDPDVKEKEREIARYNFAAALDKRADGGEVTSLSDAGEGARNEGKSFNRDCPTFDSPTTAQGQLEAMGMTSGEVTGTCPFCHETVRFDPCASRIVCSECARLKCETARYIQPAMVASDNNLPEKKCGPA